MSDIVEKMKSPYRSCDACRQDRLKAADEIERLRKIIKRMDSVINGGEAALTMARSVAKEALSEDE